jgi:hypothetical protein
MVGIVNNSEDSPKIANSLVHEVILILFFNRCPASSPFLAATRMSTTTPFLGQSEGSAVTTSTIFSEVITPFSISSN